ncbi:MAG: DUF501 domain-containing protein [Algisphaera sp.]
MSSDFNPSQGPVETVYPLLKRGHHITPFPTRYWLHDPQACQRMGELERGGAVKHLEALIAADPTLSSTYHADHLAYRDERWAALTPEDQAYVQAHPNIQKTFNTGIGGIANFTRIKCLHLHWAHHLALNGTTAGRLIEQL